MTQDVSRMKDEDWRHMQLKREEEEITDRAKL